MPTDPDPEADQRTPPVANLRIDRDARVFSAGVDRTRALQHAAEIVRLGAGRFLRPQPPCDLVVRQGNLRVSERLPDGREVTRAVLQTGAVCRVREPDAAHDSGAADSPLYSLAETSLVALGETEIWQLPAGSCGPDRAPSEPS